MMKYLIFASLFFGTALAGFAQDFPIQEAPEGFVEQRFFADVVDYGAEYLSPEYLAANTETNTLLVACKTGDRVAVLVNGKHTGDIKLGGRVSGIALAQDNIAYATTWGEFGKLHKIDYINKTVLASWTVGHMPTAPVVSQDGNFVYIANQFTHIVRKIDTATGKQVAQGRAVQQPFAMKLTPDGKELLVANHLPAPKGGLYEENIGCALSILSAETLETLAEIELPNGAINCKDIAISADGKFAYLTYVFARFNVPTTQLERGWVNTNSVAIIDIHNRKWLNSVILDDNTLGSANPWGIAISPDGKTLAVASAGSHEVSFIDLPALHEKLKEPRSPRDPAIEDDLNFLAGIRQRVDLGGGLGPRGILWFKHILAVALYYSDDIAFIDTKNDNKITRVNIGGNPKMTKARTGDLFFNDARMCFQQWVSCATCHPATRSDNLNWDLVNDGIGNPKQSKSMLFAHFTPPTMITGIRADAETCVRAGLIYIQFVEREEADAVCVDEFMKRLLPIPSPYAPAGKLSESAEMGAALFNSAGCANCHTGKYLTDMKFHDLGTAVGPDVGKSFDTPTLREVWRSAPYLFDGRAKTIFDMMKIFNENGRHGKTSDLTDQDLRDLEQYILTL